MFCHFGFRQVRQDLCEQVTENQPLVSGEPLESRFQRIKTAIHQLLT